MKVTEMSLAARGKTLTISGTVNQMIMNDNGAVDIVLNTENGGTVRIWLDTNAVENHEVEVV